MVWFLPVHPHISTSYSWKFPGVQRRFANAMTDYCYGVLSQVEVCSLGQNPSLEEFLALRRCSAGVSPLFPLVE